MRYYELFRAYCQALQAVLAAVAEVRVEVGGRSCGVIVVRECGEEILVCFLTADSPAEQQVVISPFTPFTVVFSELWAGW